ncbi:MAG: HAD-IIA family hydrolase [candidate division NC10 bacterium]|nr:HAD-IIA family hydrolase [candidate division NC10 bacterium]MBI4390935.1 HAD-IIA family hydrolase [candidate division NC10 bacterium]
MKETAVVPWREFDAFLLDLDGVVYLGGAAIPGAAETVAALRAAGKALRFLTNDPRFSVAELAAKLRGLGIAADADEIFPSGRVLARHLEEADLGGRTAYVVGTAALKEEMAAAGLQLLEGEAARHAEVVVVGGHNSLGYQEVRLAAQAVRNGAAFYATGRDATFPMPDGPWPATGAMLAAVEVASGKRAVVAGKPEPLMFEVACRDFADRRKVAVVGDTLESDIVGGKKVGCVTILVLSGSTKPEDLAASPVKPDYVLPSLAALVSGGSGPSAMR